jgi:hypothetical protein
MYAFCVSLCLPSQFFSLFPQLLVFTYDFPQVWESQGDPQHLRLVFFLYIPIPWLALISYHGVCRAITSIWSEATGSPHSRLRTKCDGTRTETRLRLSAKRTSPFKSAGASVQLTTGSRGVRISGSDAGYTFFRGSVKSTGYPLHSPVSPSLPLPCVIVCHHISTGLYLLMTPRKTAMYLMVVIYTGPRMREMLSSEELEDNINSTTMNARYTFRLIMYGSVGTCETWK